MRNRLPFYKQIAFKLIGSTIAILLLSSFISQYFDDRFTNREVERLMGNQFTNAANITENFIDFVGQSGLMAAKSLAEDPQLQQLLSLQDILALTHYFSGVTERIAADTAILLDTQGNILAVSGYPESSGNLRSLNLVRHTLTTGQPDFSIVQDIGTFILFASAPVMINVKKTKLTGIILTGYALNNNFVDNLKKNTKIDMAIVRERSIIAGTFKQGDKRLNTIPIPFTEYQMILNSPGRMSQAKINGIPYFLRASRLQAMQKNMSGSLLLAYSQEEFLESSAVLQRQHTLLLAITFGTIISILFFVFRQFLKPVVQLVKTTATIDRGDLTARVNVTSNDEFALLGEQFNNMVEGLQQQDRALRDINRDLEGQVITRTRELDEKNTLLNSILFAATDLAIAATDERLKIKYFNPDAERLFQVSKEKVLGQNVAALHARFSVSKEKFEDRLQHLQHRQSHSFSFRLPFPGETKLVEAQVSGLWDSTNRQTGYILLAKDVTSQHRQDAERREMEEQLHRAQKMEAIGLMAGGVAHDLNNILSGIVGYPELLLLELPQGSTLRQPIEAIQQSGLRAAEIVADLLTIARGVAAAKETLNLNTLIFEHLNSPEHQKIISQHEGISCRAILAPKLSPISCSKVHIKKCLMNLITNGAEAIGQDGLITINTRNQFVESTPVENETLKHGDYVVLSVIDSGGGISEEDLQRIYEPFYTKKVLGRSGTGLGLSVVWNTVEDHDAHITVQSSEGETCFEIYFPVSPESIQQIDTPKNELDELHGHGEKILVIDDEPLQRDLADKLLTTLGYHVATVKSGEEAVTYLERHTADLLILDMKMDPGINGRQTYEQILVNNPEQKAVIASGFSEDIEVTKTLQLGAGQFIEKPYSIRTIGKAVQQELQRTLFNGSN